MEVERRADPHQQRRGEPGAHPAHPQLLLGLARAHPHDLGAGLVDRARLQLVLLGGGGPERRGEAARDHKAREALEQLRFQQSQRLRGAPAIEVDRGAPPRGALTERGHEVRAVDAGGTRVPQGPQRPDERLSVGHRECRAEDRPHRLGVITGRHHEVHGRRGDIAAAVGGDQGVHPFDHLVVARHGERNAEDLAAPGRLRCRGGGRGGGVVGGDCVKIPALVLIDRDFWEGRRVLVTGHTGFKGSWLSLWLQSLGAHVTGLAPGPPTSPSLHELAGVGAGMERDRRGRARRRRDARGAGECPPGGGGPPRGTGDGQTLDRGSRTDL